VRVVVLGVLECFLHSYIVFEDFSQFVDLFRSPVKEHAGNQKADEAA